MGHKCIQNCELSTQHKHSNAPVNSPGAKQKKTRQEQRSINSKAQGQEGILRIQGTQVAVSAGATGQGWRSLWGSVVPVAKGRDEVEAAVHTVVLDVLAVEAALVPEVLLELLVDIVSH